VGRVIGTGLVSGNARMGVKNAFTARDWCADEVASADLGTERRPGPEARIGEPSSYAAHDARDGRRPDGLGLEYGGYGRDDRRRGDAKKRDPINGRPTAQFEPQRVVR